MPSLVTLSAIGTKIGVWTLEEQKIITQAYLQSKFSCQGTENRLINQSFYT